MEWKSREKELPERTSYYHSDTILVYNSNGTTDITRYNFPDNKFEAEKNYSYSTKTTHWCYITKPSCL